jgi:dTDP-glucose 4,6-dehydratase
MRVLVTGGAGFIGSHFVKRLLAAGDDVRVLDKLTYSGNPANLDGAAVELVEGDICDPDAVAAAAAGCEAIVNFAAETHVDRSILGPAEFIQTNVAGTQVLLDHARTAGIRLVHVSTDEVYGDVADGASSVEDDPLRPSSPYSAAKLTIASHPTAASATIAGSQMSPTTSSMPVPSRLAGLPE